MKKILPIAFILISHASVLAQLYFAPRVNYTLPVSSTFVNIINGDLNKDGIQDLVVANFSGASVSVFLGLGPGTFGSPQNYTTGNGTGGIAVFDPNNDGNPDIAVTNFNSNSISVLLGNGTGTFSPHQTYGTGSGPQSPILGDYNEDGKIDIAVANYTGNTVSILLGDGAGAFTPTSSFPTGSNPQVMTADLNNDTHLDLVVQNIGGGNISVRLGTGLGTFGAAVNYTTGSEPRNCVIRDFNSDSILDVVIGNTVSNTVSILTGTGSGTLNAAVNFTTTSPSTIITNDYNADGKLDLAVANAGNNTVSIYTGNGAGTFSLYQFTTVGSNPAYMRLIILDLNNDGLFDIVTTNDGANLFGVLLGNVPTGGAGTSLKFNGSNQEAQLGTWFNHQDFTVSMWVKPGTTQVANASIIDNNHTTLRSWGFEQNASVTNQYTFGGVLVNLTANAWQHVALTRSGSTSSVYLDGCLVGSVTSAAITYDGSQSLRLANFAGGGRNWNGELDEVRMFDTNLSATQIQNSINDEIPTNTTNLIAYYRMNEGSGSFIYDGTNTHTGTLVNGPVFQPSDWSLPVPTLTNFSPSSGPVGTVVTLAGTNFSTTPANNSVTFNGTAATVTASTATSITTTVPAGATTGKISVTVNCLPVLSATDFTVTAPPTINFITRWNLATAGSGSTQLSFSTATSGSVNYTWQEISPGTATGSGSWSGATLTITGLPTGATIRLQIAPTNFQRIIINSGTDRNRLTQVEQWGTTAWTSMQRAFLNCVNLQVTATDVPNLSGVTTMSEMFRGCASLNSPSNIGSWNTSVVSDMSSLFSLASSFNQNISSWNTAAVTNMSGMFADAAAFNQDIGAWNTAAVTNMNSMFAGAVVFNRNIGAWNTAAVTNMSAMFYSAYVFNQNITGWNTAAVTNMSSMFGYARDFNQNIGTWNTSAVTNMSRMFEDAFDFNQNIGTWNTSAVTNMRGMFIDAYAFNQNIGTWNTSAVTDMQRMFDFATAFNQNIGAWNTAAVTDMSGMFADASAFNQNIGAWNLNPGVNLTGMFNRCNLNCSNYSATLIAWSTNPSTPNGRILGAIGRQYGTNAVTARTNLVGTKSWTITGDTPSGTDCGAILPPTITSFTPVFGPVGTTVTITGTNFSATPANNIVYFGATRAVVTAATATQLTVTVPIGATYQSISILVNGLLAYSSKPFLTTYAGGGIIDACSFAPKQDLAAGMFPLSIVSGDFDGDGKADMAVANYDNNVISLFRNTSSVGAISYAAKIDMTSGSNTDHISTDDLDGDGKLDLVVTDVGGASVYRNTSTGIGTISFAARINFATSSDPRHLSVDDFDKDGKPDIVVANYGAGVNTISVLRNTSSGPGNITYAPKVDFASTVRPSSVSAGDLDGDGKPDIAVVNQNSNTLSVFRNTSTGIGNISFAAKVDFTTNSNPLFVSIGDLDNDDKPELAIGYSLGSVGNVISVFRNLSSGVGNISYGSQADFTVGSVPFSVHMGDVDGDGKPDLVATSVSNGIVSVLRNTSSGIGNISFGIKVDFATNSNCQSVSITDFDGDGKPDLAATSFFGVHVLRNTIGVAPSITSFTPTNGSIGTTVTITGTNFSPTPANNTVSFFNNVNATVTSSSATSITTTVPSGATTGKISVMVGCNMAMSAADFTLTPSSTNQAPVISTTTAAAQIGGIVTIDLTGLITDADDNLDLSTLQIITQPESGALASLSGLILTIDYTGVLFSGTDHVEVEICDQAGICTQQELTITLEGEFQVFNGLSPNNDGANDKFILQYIELLPDTEKNQVTIYNRWGDIVWEGTDYNNQTVVFEGINKNGKELPSGTYFYKIEFSRGIQTKTGFLSLKR